MTLCKKNNIYRHLLTRIILTIFIKILLIMYVYCLNLFENFDRSANFFYIRTTTNYSVLYYVTLLLVYKHVHNYVRVSTEL